MKISPLFMLSASFLQPALAQEAANSSRGLRGLADSGNKAKDETTTVLAEVKPDDSSSLIFLRDDTSGTVLAVIQGDSESGTRLDGEDMKAVTTPADLYLAYTGQKALPDGLVEASAQVMDLMTIDVQEQEAPPEVSFVSEQGKDEESESKTTSATSLGDGNDRSLGSCSGCPYYSPGSTLWFNHVYCSRDGNKINHAENECFCMIELSGSRGTWFYDNDLYAAVYAKPGTAVTHKVQYWRNRRWNLLVEQRIYGGWVGSVYVWGPRAHYLSEVQDVQPSGGRYWWSLYTTKDDEYVSGCGCGNASTCPNRNFPVQ